METFCSEDCLPTTLTGNITYNTKYYIGWKNWSDIMFHFIILL